MPTVTSAKTRISITVATIVVINLNAKADSDRFFDHDEELAGKSLYADPHENACDMNKDVKTLNLPETVTPIHPSTVNA